MTRGRCSNGRAHVWRRNPHTDDVTCARCYQCLGVERLLRAYAAANGDEVEGERMHGGGSCT